MKNRFTLLLLLAFTAFTFVSCDDDDNNDSNPTGKVGKYIINYGSYSGDKSTVSVYDTEEDTVINGHYKTVNKVDMISNSAYTYNYNNKIYFMGNNADQIFFVDEDSFEQTHNGIAGNDIIKPRYCVGNGDYLYVSCWGGDVWTDVTLSYLAKINIKTNTVEKKITLHGGPEALAIANNKLYAALNYKDSVAVMDLNSETFTYIPTPAVSTELLKDKNDNLYVSLISSYSMPSDKTGLGYINTTTDKLDAVYELDGISSAYVNIMSPNKDFSKIYVMTSAYDADWNLSGALATFDVASKTFDTEMFVEGVSAMNGVAVDEDNVLIFISEGVTGNGLVKKYKSDGSFVKEYETGIAPYMMLTVE